MRTIGLSALTPDESARMVSALPGADSIPGLVDLALARCGGNPLFTEELVRFTVEQEEAAAASPALVGRIADSVMPASLQTLIASRLDALPSEQKTLLATLRSSARPSGRECSPSWTCTIRRSSAICLSAWRTAGWSVLPIVHRRREGVLVLARDHPRRRIRGFPRSVRAAKHAAVAGWIDSLSEARTNLAAVRAYHYSSALELARMTHQATLAARLVDPAIAAFDQAGGVVRAYDVTSAERYFRKALT